MTTIIKDLVEKANNSIVDDTKSNLHNSVIDTIVDVAASTPKESIEGIESLHKEKEYSKEHPYTSTGPEISEKTSITVNAELNDVTLTALPDGTIESINVALAKKMQSMDVSLLADFLSLIDPLVIEKLVMEMYPNT